MGFSSKNNAKNGFLRLVDKPNCEMHFFSQHEETKKHEACQAEQISWIIFGDWQTKNKMSMIILEKM